jgi:hypothetical protein
MEQLDRVDVVAHDAVENIWRRDTAFRSQQAARPLRRATEAARAARPNSARAPRRLQLTAQAVGIVHIEILPDDIASLRALVLAAQTERDAERSEKERLDTALTKIVSHIRFTNTGVVNPVVFANFAAHAALGNCHDDPLLERIGWRATWPRRSEAALLLRGGTVRLWHRTRFVGARVRMPRGGAVADTQPLREINLTKVRIW